MDYYKKNKEQIKKNTRKNYKYDIVKTHLYSKSNAKFKTFAHKLTVDEKPRLTPDGTSLEVKCRYCGKYFIPTNSQVDHRVKALDGQLRGDHGLYCSQGCKDACPIFGRQKFPQGFKQATSREVQPQLRQLVLKRDNYTCQECGATDTELHCHHIWPLNESPITSADVDDCITYCKNCHGIKHKTPGCGYHELGC